MIITSPYNFVPLNEDIYYPEWGEKVSQDAPFSDSEDGTIEVTVENVSPLFTRDGQESGAKEKTSYSAHINMPNGQKLYYIPGSSIKGMLRATMEVMSFGKMQQYTNRWFGHREVGIRTPEGISYGEKMQEGKVKAGWLELKGETMYLYPCKDGFIKEKISDLTHSSYNTSYRRCMNKKSPWEVNRGLVGNGELYPEYTKDGKSYRLVCTGYMRNTLERGKAHEYLFTAADESKKTEIDKEVKRRFENVYDSSPHFEDFMKYMKTERVAVFYIEENRRIEHIGLTRYFRYPYQHDVKKIVGFQQTINPKALDLTETIFGTAEKDNSLKGRVQIGNAFCNSIIQDNQLQIKQLLLGQPKASYYPLYIQQDRSPYKNYDNAQAIAGRKFYRVFKSGETTTLQEENENNDNVKSTLRCLPTGQKFNFRINVHNLRPMEIGAILSALTFHKTMTSFHTIGQAKNFGYGKLGHADIKLQGLKKSVDEYLRDFELTMNIFTMGRKKPFKWNESKQLKKLVNITSDHELETLRIMKLSEYMGSKKRDVFEQLMELDVNKVRTLLSEDDFLSIGEKANEFGKMEKIAEVKSKYDSLKDEVRHNMNQCNYFSAIKAYNDIISLCSNATICGVKEIRDIKAKTEQALNENKKTILTSCCHSMFEIVDRLLTEGKNDEAKEDLKKIEDWCLSSGLTETDEIKELLNKAKKTRENINLLAFRASIANDYAKAETKETSNDVNDLIDAQGIYEDIKVKLINRNLPFEIEQSKIVMLTDRIAQIELETKKKEEEEREKERINKIEAGLTTVLDEKFTIGPNEGDFKIKNLKVCNDKVKKWLKDAGRTELTDEEKEALINTVRRIKSHYNKPKYDKDWKELEKYLGEEKTKEIFNE